MTRTRSVAVALALPLAASGCSIQKLAAELAQTIIPVDDGGADAGSASNENSLPGRAIREPAPAPERFDRCTRSGRFCLGGEDDADAFLRAAEDAESRIETLPPSVQTASFAGEPLRFALGDGGARSVGVDRLTAEPRVVVTLAPDDLSPDGLVVRALEALVLARSPATAAHDATALARAVALRFGLVAAPTEAAPESAVLGPTGGDRRGADGVFLAWLDERLSAEPGALLGATLAKADRGRDGDHWRTAGDPWFVLTRNFSGARESGPKLEDLFLRRAIEVSSTVEGRATLPFRWDQPLPRKARRLLSAKPVEPTGITWMRFERDADHPSTTVAFAVDWESHARFRFFAQLLDRDGKLVRTHRIAVPERTPHVETLVENLDGVASIVVGALELGDPTDPFDPREGPWEPHAFLFTVAPMDGDGGFYE